MLEKPALRDEALIACLRAAYGLPVRGVDFLPIGNDASAWVYRVDSGSGERWFLKLKKGAIDPPGVTIPRYLHDSGIAEVVAPLRTRSGEWWARLEGFSLILYPFIDGDVGMEVGLMDDQWRAFGSTLRQLHRTQLPPELAIRRETFAPNPAWIRTIESVEARISAADLSTDFEREMAAFWNPRREAIRQIVAQTQTLGQKLRGRSLELVVCHSDIHTANILLDHEGRLFIVDWDGVLLAPKERDLMFIDELADQQQTLFFQGYGAAAVDAHAIAYYRYEWVVQEFGDYGERVFFMDEAGDETKHDALRGFMALFDPGDVVEAAYQSDARLA